MARGTKAQEEAWLRNHRIFMLRGLYGGITSYVSGADERKAAQTIIDQELHKLGAETQTARLLRLSREGI